MTERMLMLPEEIIRALRVGVNRPLNTGRGEFYGGGIFRNTYYPDGTEGVEWRDPSNLWALNPQVFLMDVWRVLKQLPITVHQLGADLEFFIRRDGELLPVPDGLPIGDKRRDKQPVTDGVFHRDNVSVEICPNPSPRWVNLANNVISCKEEATVEIQRLVGGEVELVAEPMVIFDSFVGAIENSLELGCEPDMIVTPNGWAQRRAQDPEVMGMRRCGSGHVHISYD